MPIGRTAVRADLSRAFGQSVAVSSSHRAGRSCARADTAVTRHAIAAISNFIVHPSGGRDITSPRTSMTQSTQRVQRAQRFNRRHFLRSMAGVWPAASIGASSIEPIRRVAGSRMKLSLAAYSFRQELTRRDGPMDLMQFVDLAATYDLDAIEPTSYYFPEPVTPEYCRRLRRY